MTSFLQYSSIPLAFPAEFQGNPNARITAIYTDGVAEISSSYTGGSGGDYSNEQFDTDTAVEAIQYATFTAGTPGTVNKTGHGKSVGERVFFYPLEATITFDHTNDAILWNSHGNLATHQITFTGGTMPNASVTFSDSGGHILVSGISAHNFSAGQPVQFAGTLTGTGLSASTVYFVATTDLAADTFKLVVANSSFTSADGLSYTSSNGSGTPISYAGAGSGLTCTFVLSSRAYFVSATSLNANDFRLSATSGATALGIPGSSSGTITGHAISLMSTGLSPHITYWVKTTPTADTFTVAATYGGTAINFTGVPTSQRPCVNNVLYVPNHGYSDRDVCRLVQGSGGLPNNPGIYQPSTTRDYWLKPIDDDRLILYRSNHAWTTEGNSINGIAEFIVGGAGGTGHYLREQMNRSYLATGTSSGSGTGAVLQAVFWQGEIARLEMIDPGKGYAVNDTITLSGASIGNATDVVATVSQVGIAWARTSGLIAPSIVHGVASGVSCDGYIVDDDGVTLSEFTARPFDWLEYSWTSGDTNNDAVLTDPYTGTSVNTHTSQTGPVAAFKYKTDGSKAGKVAIRGRNAAGTGYITDVINFTHSVAAHSPSTTFYFSSTPSGDESGDDADNFSSNETTLISKIKTSGSLVWIEAGSVITTNADMALVGGSGMRIRKYGSGANPKFAHGSLTPIYIRGVTWSDIIFEDIDFETTGTNSTQTFQVEFSTTINHIYCIGGTFTTSSQGATDPNSFGKNSVAMGADRGGGFWGCTIYGQPAASFAGSSWNTCVQSGTVKFLLLMGVTTESDYGYTTFSHAATYTNCKYFGLTRYCSFTSSNSGVYGDVVHFRMDTYSGLRPYFKYQHPYYAAYQMMSDCLVTNGMSGSGSAINILNGNSSAGNQEAYGRHTHFIFQRLRMTEQLTVYSIGISSTSNVTIRDCRAWNIKGVIALGVDLGATVKSEIYRNYGYTNIATAASGEMFRLGYNSFPQGIAWTQPQLVTDNILYSANASASLIGTEFSDYAAAGSYVDRNWYYASADATNQFVDYLTSKSWNDWKAAGFDPNWAMPSETINNAANDPGWTDPGNGDFS